MQHIASSLRSLNTIPQPVLVTQSRTRSSTTNPDFTNFTRLSQSCTGLPSIKTHSLQHSARDCNVSYLNSSASVRAYRVSSDQPFFPVSVVFDISSSHKKIPSRTTNLCSPLRSYRFLGPGDLNQPLSTPSVFSRTLHTSLSMFCTVPCILVGTFREAVLYDCLTSRLKG